ncbi:hypothetical protein C2G38_2078378 [Gigaspora rosea]|uniref:Uncharacterized protein n=1 Tax=Gigaspora rosea TaxID=44941 RepID=A0A397VK83_9GLOM|nr:hypothetical protein C2G38_2078378 [Gigaspora rosea]
MLNILESIVRNKFYYFMKVSRFHLFFKYKIVDIIISTLPFCSKLILEMLCVTWIAPTISDIWFEAFNTYTVIVITVLELIFSEK